MTTVSLSLPYPPSLNRYWRNVGSRVLISADGRAYRKRVAEEIMLARYRNEIPRAPLTGLLSVRIEVPVPDNRKRDTDNLPKAIFDSLTKAGFWVDDSQVEEHAVMRIRHGVSLTSVRVIVTELQACNAP